MSKPAKLGIRGTRRSNFSGRRPNQHGKPSRNRLMNFQPASGYPLHRPRRLRGHPGLRDLVRETDLSVQDLVYPLSLDRLGEPVAAVSELGIPAILLFGIPDHKDARGSAASRDDGIVQEA